ncbi:MAG: SDR family NAD(P)-dependent oxidoreductase [Cellvibrionaceae bacterium]|nr:SDR family NAD(P)-dependent oxidoreductase [Cellvibrionaceae bacterium]MCV6626905.1 SDR family NAD(P)-dependent oxidoreductase [Cellvibrionaceae bacterium]
MDLTDKVAVVTGGASGLGKATCEQLIAQGAKVAIFDLNEDAAEQTVTELGANKACYSLVNVADEESVAAGIAKAVETFGAIHICVNCAGIASATKVLNREGQPMPQADFAKVITVNLLGSFNVARLAAEQMAKNEPSGEAQERGVIINTASVAAFDGQMGQAAYAASKGGLVGMTLPMARDLAGVGIRVNTIAPGIMGTPLLMSLPDNVKDGLIANVQFPKRLGLPAEFGELVVTIVKTAYLNAETIRLDGGIRMPPR